MEINEYRKYIRLSWFIWSKRNWWYFWQILDFKCYSKILYMDPSLY